VTRLAAGAANAEIAFQLVPSVSTDRDFERIYAKLGMHSRYELIAKAANASRDR
jgi:DNA-binding NarL/FixJ family response regulator